jgi:hypothetical protein
MLKLFQEWGGIKENDGGWIRLWYSWNNVRTFVNATMNTQFRTVKKKNQESEKTTYRMGENIYKSNKGLTFAVFKLYIDIC